MDEKTLAELKQAWGLIQANQLERARGMLVELVRQQPNLEPAWYMLSFVLPDVKQQTYALQRALSLNPANEKSRQRLVEITAAGAAQQAPPAAIRSTPETQAPAVIPTGLPSAAQPAPPAPARRKPAPRQAARPAKRSRSGPILLAAAVALLLLVVVSVIALSYLGYLDGIITAFPLAGLFEPTHTPTFTLPPPTATATATATLTPTPTVTPSPTPRPVVFTPLRCDVDDIEGNPVECGYIDVPEDRNAYTPQKVRLMLTIYHSSDKEPGTLPLLFLHGGPGGGIMDDLRKDPHLYYSLIGPFIGGRDVIVFDQRGAGLSQPSLDCQELVDVYQKDLRQVFPADQREQYYLEAFDICQSRLKLTGINLAAYTTEASAADVRDMITALGYKQVDLLAYSYGTYLAQVIMRDYPQLVHSAILDSVLPLEVKTFNRLASDAHSALNVLFGNCAADLDCNKAYPELEEVFYSQVERLDTSPVEVKIPGMFSGQSYPIRVDGAAFANAVLLGLRSTPWIPYLPREIYAVKAGDYSYLETMLAYQLEVAQRLSLGVMISVDCHEQVYATNLAELDADLALYPRLESYTRLATYGGSANLFAICDTWGAAGYDPDQSLPLSSSIPALIISGEFDPVTPLAYGRQLHENLPASYLVEVAGAGHAPSFAADDGCMEVLLEEFLDDPATPPHVDCTTTRAWTFILPAGGDVTLVAFTNRQYAIQGLAPKGWKAVDYNFYNRQASLRDPTQIGMQSAANVSIKEWLDFLMKNFKGVGLDTYPEFFDQRQANGFTWRLHRADYNGNPVDIALAETGKGMTYAVIMLSLPDERTALFQSVYLRVIDALKPLE